MESEKVINIDYFNDAEFDHICKELDSKDIHDISERLAYVKKNNDGPTYLYFMFKELDDNMLNNYNKIPNEYLFSKAAVDGLLRSYLFVLQYMKTSLPQHAYEHVKNKSNSFIFQLEEQLKSKK